MGHDAKLAPGLCWLADEVSSLRCFVSHRYCHWRECRSRPRIEPRILPGAFPEAARKLPGLAAAIVATSGSQRDLQGASTTFATRCHSYAYRSPTDPPTMGYDTMCGSVGFHCGQEARGRYGATRLRVAFEAQGAIDPEIRVRLRRRRIRRVGHFGLARYDI